MADERLVKYIVETKRQGFRLDKVKATLEKAGWKESQIHEAIKVAVTPHGSIQHHLETSHTSGRVGLIIALSLTFLGVYAFSVISKPLSYLLPQTANPLGEYLIVPMGLAILVIIMTMGLAMGLRKVLGVM